MNASRPTIRDADLQAWVDGRLAPDDAARVQQALDADPALAALARHYREQNAALRSRFDAELDEPVPAALLEAARGNASRHTGAGAEDPAVASDALDRRPGDRRATGPTEAVRPAGAPAANRRWFAQAAALLTALCVGIAAGWLARGDSPRRLVTAQPASLPLARAATLAHAAFAPEVRHPVEVGAAERAHLLAWLSKRLGTTLKVPDLEPEGFRLVGGRLLPDARDGVAAQFMFETANGQRLTLFLRRDENDGDTAFRFAEQDRLRTFYWLDRGFGYALSGELPRDTMLSIANAVYRQLNP